MHFQSLLLSFLAASSAVAKRTCGTPQPSDEQLQISQNLQLQEAELKAAGNTSRLAAAAAPIRINVYWHVVATSNSVSGGYLSQATLDAQLAVLNDAYAPHDISFTQAGADWTINSNWANDRSELAMKRALRKGTYADLNVYFIPGTQYLGYAYFPRAVTAGSNNFYLDGVVCVSASVPGGSLREYNLGHTATHEVGHWLGLYHTFEGYACSGNGDYVDDTPFESEPAYGCPLTRDTCPNDPGFDPVENYMDYSDDPCFTHFTEGQQARMYSYWDAYRASFQ